MRRFLQRYGWSYAFILPSLITFAAFVLIPVLSAFVISFQNYSLARGGTWMTPLLSNYETAFSQQGGIFVTAIRNTLLYSLFTVSSNILAGLALASVIQPLSHRLR